MSVVEYKPAYSIKEAGEAAGGLGRSTIYSHIAAGRLKAKRIGGRTIITGNALREFIEGEAA